MNRVLRFVFALALAGAAQAAPAATLDFSFSFTNTINGGGGVTGVVRGLREGFTTAATSVEVTGNTGGFGLGEYAPGARLNAWTVTDGAITAADFVSFSEDVTPARDSSLGFEVVFFLGSVLVNTSLTPGNMLNYSIQDGPVFAPIDDVAPVPAPAAVWLLLTAAGALCALRRRAA